MYTHLTARYLCDLRLCSHNWLNRLRNSFGSVRTNQKRNWRKWYSIGFMSQSKTSRSKTIKAWRKMQQRYYLYHHDFFFFFFFYFPFLFQEFNWIRLTIHFHNCWSNKNIFFVFSFFSKNKERKQELFKIFETCPMSTQGRKSLSEAGGSSNLPICQNPEAGGSQRLHLHRFSTKISEKT